MIAKQSEGARLTRADIVFVGAGPATFGLITNAIKTNRLNELASSGDGIAILEQGLTFGGGDLVNFGINSNTSASGFIKCCHKNREMYSEIPNDDQPLSPSKRAGGRSQAGQFSNFKRRDASNNRRNDEDSDDELAEDSERSEDDQQKPKSNCHTQIVPLNCYKDFYNVASIYKRMQQYGQNIVPLSLVGLFLNYCGNHLLHFVHSVLKRKIFYPCHRVVSVQLLQNGEILTFAKRQSIKIKKVEGKLEYKIASNEQTVQFRSKAIVISNGAQQTLHPDFFDKWFPFLEERRDDVILTDQFLKKDKYKEVIDRVNKDQLKNIVIVGGSHSAFSTAWLLLNGPATHKYNNQLSNNEKNTDLPGAMMKTNQFCTDCCGCPQRQKNQRNQQCFCICKCYGFFEHKDWDFDPSIDLPKHLGVGSIKIIYRDRIRVFYGTVEQAEEDGYKDFNQSQFTNKRNYLYSYTGLRGDAKGLYKRIRSGAEKRVQIIKAATVEEQAEHLQSADLIFWGCGYQTNKIQIKDHEGKPIELDQKVIQTQFDIDGKCRICTKDSQFFTKVFGTGIAYPTRTNDGAIRPEPGKMDPRADSFSLYSGWVANRVLLNLLPKTMLDNKVHRQQKKIKRIQPPVEQNHKSAQKSHIKMRNQQNGGQNMGNDNGSDDADNEQMQQGVTAGSGGEGTQPYQLAVYIPPQITKSQEEYISKTQQYRAKQQAEQKKQEDRYKPTNENKFHRAVQSRYLQPKAPKQAESLRNQSMPQYKTSSPTKKSNGTQSIKRNIDLSNRKQTKSPQPKIEIQDEFGDEVKSPEKEDQGLQLVVQKTEQKSRKISMQSDQGQLPDQITTASTAVIHPTHGTTQNNIPINNYFTNQKTRNSKVEQHDNTSKSVSMTGDRSQLLVSEFVVSQLAKDCRFNMYQQKLGPVKQKHGELTAVNSLRPNQHGQMTYAGTQIQNRQVQEQQIPVTPFVAQSQINNSIVKKTNKLLTSPINVDKSTTLYSHQGYNQSENCDTAGHALIFGQTSEQQLSVGVRDDQSYDDDYSENNYCRTNSKSSIPNSSLSPPKNKGKSHERHLQDLQEMKTQFTQQDTQQCARSRTNTLNTIEDIGQQLNLQNQNIHPKQIMAEQKTQDMKKLSQMLTNNINTSLCFSTQGGPNKNQVMQQNTFKGGSQSSKGLVQKKQLIKQRQQIQYRTDGVPEQIISTDKNAAEKMQNSQKTPWQQQLQPTIFMSFKQDGACHLQFDQKLTPKKLLNPLRSNGTNIFQIENSNFSFKNSMNQEFQLNSGFKKQYFNEPIEYHNYRDMDNNLPMLKAAPSEIRNPLHQSSAQKNTVFSESEQLSNFDTSHRQSSQSRKIWPGNACRPTQQALPLKVFQIPGLMQGGGIKSESSYFHQFTNDNINQLGGSMTIGPHMSKKAFNEGLHNVSANKYSNQRKSSMNQEEAKDFSNLLNDQNRPFYPNRVSEQKSDFQQQRQQQDLDQCKLRYPRPNYQHMVNNSSYRVHHAHQMSQNKDNSYVGGLKYFQNQQQKHLSPLIPNRMKIIQQSPQKYLLDEGINEEFKKRRIYFQRSQKTLRSFEEQTNSKEQAKFLSLTSKLNQQQQYLSNNRASHMGQAMVRNCAWLKDEVLVDQAKTNSERTNY